MDGAALLAVGLPGGPVAMVGVLFALAYCRTVLADGRRLAEALGMYLVAFAAATVLAPVPTLPLAQVLGTCAGLLISSYLMYFVQSTLLAREAAVVQRNEALASKESFLSAVLDNVADGVIACTPDSQITVFNQASRRLHGQVDGEPSPRVIPSSPGLLDPHDRSELAVSDLPLSRALRGEHVRDLEVLLLQPGGGERTVVATGQPLGDADSTRPLGAVLTLHDVTEQRLAEAALAHQSMHDPLTGLANRVVLLDRLEHALVRSSRHPAATSLLFIDVDHLKKVNDTLGHAAGDAVLRTVADRLHGVLREDDTAARLGGDEFAVLLEDTPGWQAAEVAQRILIAMRPPMELAGRSTIIGVSIGVAETTIGAADASMLLRHADLAMYAAKRAGRGRTEVFEPSMQAELVEQVSLENDLRGAIERGELTLAYQPVVSLRSGAVYGAEALMRWRHPVRGDVARRVSFGWPRRAA